MNQLIHYLSMIPQTKELVVLIGENADCRFIEAACKMICLERMVIFTNSHEVKKKVIHIIDSLPTDTENHVPECIEFCDSNEYDHYRPMFNPMAFCFDAVKSNADIVRFSTMNPQYVFGIVHKDYTNAFVIWESFRHNAEKIYIISNHANDETLNWSKGSSNIELSVIFPMYNIAKYLPECVESIRKWQADYVEYLFIDDGSPDNCAEIIQHYAGSDSRIKLLKKKNGGCASARQYGLEHARGRYIGFIDPDDYIDTTMFKKLFERALCGSYEIAYCGYNELYESDGSTREIPDLYGKPYSIGTVNQESINRLISYLRVAIWRGIYARDLIERNNIHFYTDLRRFDDLPFKVEVLSKARSVVAIPEHLYYYRLARPGQDVAANDERLYVHFPIFNYLDQFIRKSSDQSQLDCLQIVKIHTHKYALEKIQPEYVREYMRQAQKDIRSNFIYLEGAYIIRNEGRRILLWYTALYFGLKSLCKALLMHNKKDRDSMAKVKEKLKKLADLNRSGNAV